jgi:hypothetical protein
MTLNYCEHVFVWDDLSVPMPVKHQAALKVESQNEVHPNQFVLHQDMEEVLPIRVQSIARDIGCIW